MGRQRAVTQHYIQLGQVPDHIAGAADVGELLQAAPAQLLPAGALAQRVDGDAEAAVARADLDIAGIGAADTIGELLPGGCRLRRRVATLHVDGEAVGGTVEVTGRADALRHAIHAGQAVAAVDLSAAGQGGVAVAVFRDNRNIELRLEHPFADVHAHRTAEHLAVGVLPLAAHGDAEVDDASRHDIAAAQLGQFRVAQLDRLQRVAGLDGKAGDDAAGSQQGVNLHVDLRRLPVRDVRMVCPFRRNRSG
ncbi:hypothetical protein D9M71_583100 [compost metagenome]